MSTIITQTQRPLQVHTVAGENALLLSALNGTEAISQPYSFQLELVSIRPDFDAETFLGTPVLVTVRMPVGEQRRIHGFVSRFAQLGKHDNLVLYRAEIVPWLWFLTLSRESRIYQELTVPDILEEVFRRTGGSDFEFRLTRSYPQRLYTVQYRETHFDFVSRLMEEEGIHYYFEHSNDKHLLVLADDNGQSKPAPGAGMIRYTTEARMSENVITEWEHEHALRPGKITMTDYNFEMPSASMMATLGNEKFELYDYPGMYYDLDDGERRVRLLLEAEEADRLVVRGVSDAAGLTPGHEFTLRDHYRPNTNGKYLITGVHHVAHTGAFRASEENARITYRNEFLAIPYDTPYRPRRRTPRPVIRGTQTATVVGPPGEEIYTDKYGRVKVQFHWDRDGHRDENSSCWVRVSSIWAGKGWGVVFLPRVGTEVVVDFLEGDADQPLIVGQVYNGQNRQPYELPANHTQSGIKTRSSPNGSPSNFNEIRFEDKKDAEEIYIHAERNMRTVVEANEMRSIGGSRTTTIRKKDETLIIKEGSRTVTVEKGDDILEVKTGNREVNVTEGDDVLFVPSGNIERSAPSGAYRVSGKEVVIDGSASVTITCGGSTIELTPGKIAISSPVIDVQGGAVTVKGGIVKINC